MEIKNVVLASASPRRNELLLQIGIQPEIVVSHVVERVTSSVPSEVVMELASQKAADVAAGRKAGETVIGSDTVVAIDGKILGKPKTHEEAREMIGMLSGRVHQVYTGVCVILKGEDGNDCSRVFSTRPMWRCTSDRGGDLPVRHVRGTHGQGRSLRRPGLFCQVYQGA